jgi:hypothetical protein
MQQLLPKKALSGEHDGFIDDEVTFIIINLSISFSIDEALLVVLVGISIILSTSMTPYLSTGWRW